MGYKKKPKNKQEIDSFSGFKPPKEKVEPDMKLVCDFQFTDLEGVKWKKPLGRIKILTGGGLSFLIQTEGGGWKPIKAKLDYLNIKYERRVLDSRWKVPRKSS